MAGKTDYLENALLNAVFRGVAFPSLPTLYFALFTTVGAEDSTGFVEASYGGYARVPVASAAGNFKDPAIATQGQVQNLVKIVFHPNLGPSAETQAGWGVYDAPSSGNLLYFGTLSQTVNRLEQPLIDTQQLTISED